MPGIQLLELASGFISLANGNGGIVTVDLPAVPPISNEVWGVDVSVNAIVGWALDADRSLVAPISAEDTVQSPTLLLGGFVTNSHYIPLSPHPFHLPGPVVLRVFNNSGATINFYLALHFRRVAIDKLDWAMLMNRRSFERG